MTSARFRLYQHKRKYIAELLQPNIGVQRITDGDVNLLFIYYYNPNPPKICNLQIHLGLFLEPKESCVEPRDI